MEAPRVAEQLWFIGHYYNTAKICPERQGGYGEALIAFLREGVNGLPAYTNLYRHKKYTRSDKPISEDYGHPMGEQSRAEVLDGLKDWLRGRLFPWLSQGHVDELGTFVYADTKPSPRAQDGCNDDRVMSLALAVKMFREFGQVAHEIQLGLKETRDWPCPVRAGFIKCACEAAVEATPQAVPWKLTLGRSSSFCLPPAQSNSTTSGLPTPAKALVTLVIPAQASSLPSGLNATAPTAAEPTASRATTSATQWILRAASWSSARRGPIGCRATRPSRSGRRPGHGRSRRG